MDRRAADLICRLRNGCMAGMGIKKKTADTGNTAADGLLPERGDRLQPCSTGRSF